MYTFPATFIDGLDSAFSAYELSSSLQFKADPPSSHTPLYYPSTLLQIYQIIQNTTVRCFYLSFPPTFCAYVYFFTYFVTFYCAHCLSCPNVKQSTILYGQLGSSLKVPHLTLVLDTGLVQIRHYQN